MILHKWGIHQPPASAKLLVLTERIRRCCQSERNFLSWPEGRQRVHFPPYGLSCQQEIPFTRGHNEPISISPQQEQNIPLHQRPKEIPNSLCYSTYDVSRILSRRGCSTSNHSWFSSPISPLCREATAPLAPSPGAGRWVMEFISCYTGSPWPLWWLLLTIDCNLCADRSFSSAE